MIFNRIEYSYAGNRVYGIPEGETASVELVWTDDSTGFELHPSEVWARAEQALLQEQRDAEIAREKEERLNGLIDAVLATHIPYRICSHIPGWVGAVVIRDDIVYLLRKEGYLQ